MSDGRTSITPLWHGVCPYCVEIARDTYVGCRLPAGHDGPCQPRPAPFQVTTQTARAE